MTGPMSDCEQPAQKARLRPTTTTHTACACRCHSHSLGRALLHRSFSQLTRLSYACRQARAAESPTNVNQAAAQLSPWPSAVPPTKR